MPAVEEILVARFTSRLKGECAYSAEAQRETIAKLLLAGVDRGREVWGSVHFPDETFADYLGDLLDGHEGDIVPLLERLHLSDLYLVCGCLNGAVGAIPAFDKAFLRGIDRWPGFAQGIDVADDVRQILREKLFVGDGVGCAKLATYSGQGRLASWVAVAAHRAALSLARRNGARAQAMPIEELEQVIADLPDPELACIRARYEPELRDAFRTAVLSLSQRDRLILRLNLVDGVTLDRIAKMYGVSQSTVSRWLAATREAIREEVQRIVAERLGLRSDEAVSLTALIASDFGISLTKLLGAE